MSDKPTPDPKAVLEKYRHPAECRNAEQPEEFGHKAESDEAEDAALELWNALDATLKQLEAAVLCRKCGRPLGSYCVQCAWPHRRSRDQDGRGWSPS